MKYVEICSDLCPIIFSRSGSQMDCLYFKIFGGFPFFFQRSLAYLRFQHLEINFI